MIGGMMTDDPKDERSATRGYPLPHPDNRLRDDVARLRTATAMVDADMTETRRRLLTIEDALFLGFQDLV